MSHERFFWLDPLLPKPVDIDDVGSLPLLRRVADKAEQVEMEVVLEWVDNYFAKTAVTPQSAA